MATNNVKFPIDLVESSEHQHYLYFRIYSNSSASLGGSSKGMASEDNEMASAPGEDSLLSKLDNSRGQTPNYSNVGDSATAKKDY